MVVQISFLYSEYYSSQFVFLIFHINKCSKALFASFEGRGRKGLGGEGKGERRENLPLVWELKKPRRKEDEGLM